MNELQQIRFVPDGTEEQAQAVSLHYEITHQAGPGCPGKKGVQKFSGPAEAQ